MAILSDPELIEQLGEILNKISYLSNEVEIGDLAEDALQLIEKQRTDKQDFLTSYAKGT